MPQSKQKRTAKKKGFSPKKKRRQPEETFSKQKPGIDGLAFQKKVRSEWN
jgi:hypothetical protein